MVSCLKRLKLKAIDKIGSKKGSKTEQASPRVQTPPSTVTSTQEPSHPSSSHSVQASDGLEPPALSTPVNPSTPNETSTEKQDDTDEEENHILYNGVTTILEFLVAGSDAFAPLKSAASGLDWLVKRGETVRSNVEDFATLGDDLRKISVLRSHIRFNPSPPLSALQKELSDRASQILDEVKTRQNHKLARRAVDASDDANFILKCYDNIRKLSTDFQTGAIVLTEQTMEQLENHVKALDERATIGTLPHVPAATFTAQINNHGCLKDTRVDVLDKILSWANDPDDRSVYWLCGMAGTGKSTIAQTVCKRLHEGDLLGGSFFCSKQASVDQQDVARIIPTLATLIARKSDNYRSEILQFLRKTPGDELRQVSEQFQHLLLTPIQSVFKDSTTHFVLVVDALDECENPTATRDFLTLILEHAASLVVKFFVTSRPEERIREEFLNTDSSSRSILQLHNIEQVTVDGDVRTYLSAKLRGRVKRDFEHPEELWPSGDQLDQLVDLCGQLFIYASTTCQYIKEHNPKRRLEELLADGKLNAERGSEPIDLIYNHILHEAFIKLNNKEVSEVKTVLAAIVYGYDPLSLRELGALLDIDADNVRAGLSALHSVIQVPDENEGVNVTTIHFSFVEYITDSERSGSKPWFLPSSYYHNSLARHCLTLLNTKLHFNISKCETSYHPSPYNENQIAREIRYASHFSFDHFRDMAHAPLPDLLELLGTFFRENFLYWVEVMTTIRGMYGAKIALSKLGEYLSNLEMEDLGTSPEPIDLVFDAIDFMHRFWDPVMGGSAHIYLSALAFEHPNSLITASYLEMFPNLPVVHRETGLRDYLKPIFKIKGEPNIAYIAMSPNRLRWVSAEGSSAKIWDMGNRNSSFGLEGHKGDIHSITFSPNGKYIASGSQDTTIRIWNAETGICARELKGHSEPVWTVAFSPDSNFIVSGSLDQRVIIWDIHSKEHRALEGHNEAVTCVGLSLDGLLIVSGDGGGEIRLWNVRTGQLLRTFEGPYWIFYVAFLADNRRFSFIAHQEMGIYDSKTGICLHLRPIPEEYGMGLCALTQDGTRAVSCGVPDSTFDIYNIETDERAIIDVNGFPTSIKLFNSEYIVTTNTRGYIYIWDAKQLEQNAFYTRTRPVTLITFSLDGSLLASMDAINVIRVWQSGTGNLISKFSNKKISLIKGITFSSDGQILLSAHSDGQLRQWDTSTGQSIASKSFSKDGSDMNISLAAFSSNAPYLAVGYETSRIRLVKTDDLTDMFDLKETDCVSCMALSSDGTRFAYGSDVAVKLWHIIGTQVVSLKEFKHDDAIRSLILSEDGAIIVSTSSASNSDPEIHIQNVVTGRRLATISAYDTHIAITPTGEYLATVNKYNGINIWDVVHESLSQTLYSWSPYRSSISAFIFSSDGMHIAHGFENGSIEISVIGHGNEEAVFTKIQKHCQHIPPHPSLLLSSDPTHALLSTCDLFEERQNPIDHQMDSNGWIVGDDEPPSFSEAANPRQPSGSLERYGQSTGFHLNKDGWLYSSVEKQVLWIPYKHHHRLCTSENTVIMGRTRLNIDLSRFRHGKSWTECKA